MRRKKELRSRFDALVNEVTTTTNYDDPASAIRLLNELEPMLGALKGNRARQSELLIQRCKWVGLRAIVGDDE